MLKLTNLLISAYDKIIFKRFHVQIDPDLDESASILHQQKLFPASYYSMLPFSIHDPRYTFRVILVSCDSIKENKK